MNKYLIILSAISILTACVEPFEFETRRSENVLIVEATITDVEQLQQVHLSRAADLQSLKETPVYNPNLPFKLEEERRLNPEHNATVVVIDDLDNTFIFSEINNEGIYESEIPFAALSSRGYQLHITTSENQIYSSDFKSPTGSSSINQLYAERTTNELGEDGMAIYVDGSDTSSTSNYFRYTYEETYKIIAPNWSPNEFKIIREVQETLPDGSQIYPAVELIPRVQEEKVCYRTVASTNINLANTFALTQSVTERNQVRFISSSNPILTHRYSILVKQYIQSIEAHSYYENLRNFAKSESVFSAIQPGFLEGNVQALDNENLVIGYFDVASSAEKRLFFNYEDYYAGEEKPPYFLEFNCDRMFSPPILDPNLDGPTALNCPQSLIPKIKLGLVELVSENGTPGLCEGPYYVTPSICGDCTILGSNIIPDFWVE